MELATTIHEASDLFRNIKATAQILAMKKGVELKIETPLIQHEKWEPVIADASRVEQIFMNLITNAVKFTPEGGTVTLYMDTVAITEQQVTNQYIISDTGIGMSEEFQEHLFEPFAQENRGNQDYESGTGLGLSIAKQIINLMGGSIHVESQKNEGTKITVILSYPRYHGSLEETSNCVVDFSILKGKRVLLCEDHPINAQIAIRLLDRQGVIVEQVANGLLGVERFKESKDGYYDAILMDIRMPVMNGIEATRNIRAMTQRVEAKEIPIIAMTANAFDEDIRQCREAGMNAHVAKPVNPEKLYKELEKWIK